MTWQSDSILVVNLFGKPSTVYEKTEIILRAVETLDTVLPEIHG